MNQFLKEITEQPDAISRLCHFYDSKEGKEILKQINEHVNDPSVERIIFTGMGSSFFIAHAITTLFNESGLDKPAFTVNASELLHYNQTILKKDSLLFCISQSGESFEVKKLLATHPDEVRCIGVVNEENSVLSRESDVALLCKGGEEKMTSTKTYVVTMLSLQILLWYLKGEWDKSKVEILQKMRNGFASLLGNYESEIKEQLNFFGDIDTIQIIARGPAFATASQCALMFKEALRIPATGILGGEFRHGPMEMVTPGFKSIIFAPKGITYHQSIKMAEDIIEFGGKVLLITNELIDTTDSSLLQSYVQEDDEYLFAVRSVLSIQLFIDMYAKERGYKAGSFSHGNKITVIE